MVESEKENVLLLLWHSQNKRPCIDDLPESVSKRYRFYYQQTAKNDPHTCNFNLIDYVEDAKKLIKKHNISVVLSTTDLSTLVSAALAQELPEKRLRVPSVESVFLCNNKYYAHCFLNPDPVPFAFVDLSVKDLDAVCDEVVQKVPFPAFFKPCSGAMGFGAGSIMAKEQLAPTLQSYISKYVTSDHSPIESISTTVMNPFYIKYLDVNQYPLSLVPSAIIEKHMGTVTTVNADGCVFEGEIICWAISDNLYYKTKPSSFIAVAHPTALSQSLQTKVWKLFDYVVQKLIGYGFNNQFVNLEVFVLEDGDVKLMEVNPRAGMNISLYSSEVFDQSSMEALLKIGQGIHPGIPVANGHHAFWGVISTTGSGEAKEFLDFGYPGIVPLVQPNDHVNGSAEAGGILAQVCLIGDSRDEVMDKWRTICHSVLLKPELSIWE